MILAHAVPPLTTRGLSGCTEEEDGLVAKVGTSKKGSTISLLAAVHLECMLQAQLKKRRRRICGHLLRCVISSQAPHYHILKLLS